MQLLIYCLVYPFLWMISKLPWRFFYAFSDLVFILVYYLIGYRKKVVLENLNLVFPDTPTNEIISIQRKFYKHMCDMFLEMIKSISISNEEMISRFKVTNLDMVQELEAKGKNIIVVMAHYASYEWCNVVDLQTNFQAVGIYKPIKNKYFDRLVHNIRGRFGSRVIPNNKSMKIITSDQKKPGLFMYGLITDQTPSLPNAKYWTDFMGIKVPTIVGAEVLSNRLDLDVYYMQVHKVKRGFYEATFIPLNDNKIRKEGEFYIIKKYLRLLEEQIRKKPELYLWTHKRWKHRNAQIPEDATID